MSRLLVLVEGKTEETFVNEILERHLLSWGYTRVSARLIGKARRRSQRGGILPWSPVKSEVVRFLKDDRGTAIALMVDYYRLPKSEKQAWLGRSAGSGAEAVEHAVSEDIANAMGRGFDRGRFLPGILMHEFEALLFSDCEAFGRTLERPGIGRSFQNIRNRFANPEEIDDSPDGAPSKRIEKLVSNYEKVTMGNLAALEIGLNKIRAECPHFRSWLERLEVRGSAGP